MLKDAILQDLIDLALADGEAPAIDVRERLQRLALRARNALDSSNAGRVEWQTRRRHHTPWRTATREEALHVYKVVPALVRGIVEVEGAVPCSSR